MNNKLKIIFIVVLSVFIVAGIGFGVWFFANIDLDEDDVVVDVVEEESDLAQDIETWQVEETYIDGQLVARRGESKIDPVSTPVINHFNCQPKSPADFKLERSDARASALIVATGLLTLTPTRPPVATFELTSARFVALAVTVSEPLVCTDPPSDASTSALSRT